MVEPDRWDEVVALANLEPCATEGVPSDLAQLRAWHADDPDALAVLPGFQLYEALGEQVDPDDVDVLTHASHALERCGNLTDTMVALAIQLTVCDAHPTAFAAAWAPYAERPSLRSVAAREAVSAWALVTENIADEGRVGAQQAGDLGGVLVGWVLQDDERVPPPRLERSVLRPLVGVMTTGIDTVWDDLQGDRDRVDACVAAAPPPPPFTLTAVDLAGIEGMRCAFVTPDGTPVLVDEGSDVQLGIDGRVVRLGGSDRVPREGYFGDGVEVRIEQLGDGSRTLQATTEAGKVTTPIEVRCGS